MARYYDIILGLIPLALFGVTAALVAVGVGVTTAAPVGAAISVAFMGHALFVRAPVDSEPRDVATPAESTVESGSPAATPFEAAD